MLSVSKDVGGCLCPISSRTICAGIASRKFTQSVQSSASAAEEMTVFIIWDMVMTSPLLGGFADLFVRTNILVLCFSIWIQKGIRYQCVQLEPCHYRGM